VPPRRRLSRRLLWPAIALLGALGFAWYEDSRAPKKPAPRPEPVRLQDETRMDMRPAPSPKPPPAPGEPTPRAPQDGPPPGSPAMTR